MITERIDGSRELRTGLTRDEASELAADAIQDPDVASVSVYDEKRDSGPYPNNRHGRRQWARDLRKHNKRKNRRS